MDVSSEQYRRYRRRFIHPIVREVEIKPIQDSGTPLARARDGDDTSTLSVSAMEKKRTRPYLTTEYSDPKMVGGVSGMPKKLRRTDSISDLCLMRSIASEFIPGVDSQDKTYPDCKDSKVAVGDLGDALSLLWIHQGSNYRPTEQIMTIRDNRDQY